MSKSVEGKTKRIKIKNKKIILLFLFFILSFMFNVEVNANEKYGEFYEKQNEYVTRILPETTLQDLKNNLENQNIQVTTENGKVFSNTEYIRTGMNLSDSENLYKISVIGDVDGNGKITITDATKINLHKNNLKTLDDKYLLSADLNNDGKISITDVVQINLVVVNLKDIIAPVSFEPEITATKNIITIEGTTTDKMSGVAEYSFRLDNGEWIQNTNKVNGRYIFSGIDATVEHTILMKVKDNAGNEKKTKITNIKIPTGQVTITPSTTEWTNQNVNISLDSECSDSTLEKYISIDGGTTFEKYTSPVSVSKNTKIVAKLEGKIYKEIAKAELNITNIDKLEPKAFDTTATTSTDTITITARTQDEEATNEYGKSGLKEYEYKIQKGTTEIKQTSTQTTYTFTNIPEDGAYVVTVAAIDNAGNRRISNAGENNTIEVISRYTINYDPNEGEVTPSSTTAKYGEEITMPTPTRVYKIIYNTNGGTAIEMQSVSSIFRGWYTQKIGGDVVEYTTMPEIENRSTTVYAHWNTPYINLPTPEKSGSTFDGWYENSSLSGTGYRSGDSYVPTKDTTFYAKWK